MNMRWKVWGLIMLLIGSIVPMGFSFAGSNTTQLNQTVLNIDNETREQLISARLINQLDKISSIVEGKIEPLKDKLPENSSILTSYEKAENFKEKAIEEYNDGDYYSSILDSLSAMHYYKIVLQEFKEGKEKYNEARERIQGQIERMMGYFRMIERTIKIAESQGLDVSNISQTFNETKDAYRVVLEDLKAKDFDKAKEDLKVVQEKKKVLDEEFRELREELAHQNADKIVREFLERTAKGIDFANRSIEYAKGRGVDTTGAEARLAEVEAIYNQVNALAQEEKWDEALNVIEKNRETLTGFMRTLNAIHERIVQERMKRNFRGFMGEIGSRMRKDVRALRELNKKGVDTRRAELQLRTAAQEIGMGMRLLKEKKPEQAKMHFAIALRLMNEVEEFIVMHS